MKNRKGFTLIEIIAVVIIIGIIAIVVVPSVSSYIFNTRNSTYKAHEIAMEEAAKSMTIETINGKDNFGLPKQGNHAEVYLSELLDKEYLDKLKDPATGEECNEAMSYVIIKGLTNSTYDYTACLYCGKYITEKDECSAPPVDDNTPPTCGIITGESSEWTNKSRTIIVACSDAESGCVRSKFSRTFNTTTDKGNVTISDKSGKTTQCEVNVRVDKTEPTCELEVIGDENVESTGWSSGRSVVVRFKANSRKDEHSGVATYGIGTSIKNKSYNKQESYAIDNISGTTTVIGYVKDNAGNEGTCYKTVTTGLEKPQFDVRYGYQVYPKKEKFTLTNAEQVGDNQIKTNSTNPSITFNNMSKYKNVTAVIMDLAEGISDPASFKLEVGGNIYSGASDNSSNTRIRFYIEFEPGLSNLSSKSEYKITLGNKKDVTYTVTRIELEQKDGNRYTKDNVAVNLITRKSVVKTTNWSWDNMAHWDTKYYKMFDVRTEGKSGTAVIKNDIPLTSLPKEFSINKGDKTGPSAELTSSPTSWTNQDITISATASDSESGIIAYAWSTSSTINYYSTDWQYYNSPVASDTYTHKATTNGTYYLHLKDEAGNVSKESIAITKIDRLAPTCSAISGQASLSCTDPAATSTNGQSKIVKYYWGTKSNPSDSDFKAVTATASFTKNETVSSGSGTKYYVFVMDEAGNKSAAVSDIYYTVTYDKNGGDTIAKTSDIRRNNTNADLGSSFTATKTGYDLKGWNSSKTATTILSSYKVTADATLYAIWEAKSYTLTYYCNGGTGDNQTQSIKYDSTWKTKGSICTKTGYIMDGWATSASSGVAYGLNANQSAYKATPTKLYAHWKPREFTVYYYPNGGSGSVQSRIVSPVSDWSTEGAIFTKDGYTLDGWSTSKTGSIAYNLNTNQGKYTGNADLSLYAHWKANSYTITYTANGGTGSNQTQSVTYNGNFTTKGKIFSREGYNIIGWYQRLKEYDFVDCLYRIYYDSRREEGFTGYYSVKVDKAYSQSEAHTLCINSMSTYKETEDYARYVRWLEDRMRSGRGSCKCEGNLPSVTVTARDQSNCYAACAGRGYTMEAYSAKCSCIGSSSCNSLYSTSGDATINESQCMDYCRNRRCPSGRLTSTCTCKPRQSCSSTTVSAYSEDDCNLRCKDKYCQSTYTAETFDSNKVRLELEHAMPHKRYEIRDYGLSKQYQFVYPSNITLYADWQEKASCPAGTTMVAGADTDSPTCCANCNSVSNGSCTLGVSSSNTCQYTTSCNSGYTLVSGSGTNSPVCCKSCPTMSHGSCSVSWNGSSCVYTTSCNKGYRLSGNGTSSASCTRCEGWRLTNPNDDVFNTIDKVQGQKWEYLTTSDTNLTGWQKVHGDIYSNQVSSDSSGNGVCDTGEDNVGWFYMSKKNNILRIGWVCDNDKWYYLWTGMGGGDFRDYPSGELSGRMVQNATNIEIEGSKYSFNDKGECTAGPGCNKKCSESSSSYLLD